MQHTCGQPFVGETLRCKTEHVSGGDGTCRNADDVDDATQPVLAPPKGSSAEGIVGLNLKGKVELIVKGDDATLSTKVIWLWGRRNGGSGYIGAAAHPLPLRCASCRRR